MIWIILVAVAVGFILFWKSANRSAQESYEKAQSERNMLMESGQWVDARWFEGDLAPVQNKNGSWGLVNRDGKCVAHPFCDEITHSAYGYWICEMDVHRLSPKWMLISDGGERFGPYSGSRLECISHETGRLTLNDYPHDTQVEFKIGESIPSLCYIEQVRHGALIACKRNIDGLWAIQNHHRIEIPWMQSYGKTCVLWKDVKQEYPYLRLFDGYDWFTLSNGWSSSEGYYLEGR